jgi:long-chain acyl-CoA synthetase
VLTHANLLANARSTVEAVDNTSSDRVLALLPFSRLLGLTVTGSAPLLAGAEVITMSQFEPQRTVALLERGVTEVVGAPAVFRALLAAIEQGAHSMRDTALRVCICSGAPLPRELQDRWAETTGLELRQGYGLTEASPMCLFNDVALPNVRGTLGVPYPRVDVEIFPPATVGAATTGAATTGGVDAGADVAMSATPLPVGTPGEICVRGENVFRGYLGGSAAGLRRRGDWLCSGDLGVRGADRTITFLGTL